MGKTGAVISECKKYRFKLWRVWDESKPNILWIMHNPSKADQIDNDRTINKIIRFSKLWGYGGIYVGNLFPYRSTEPENLLNKPFEEIAPLVNIRHINEMKKECSAFILAYGNPIIKDATPTFFDAEWMALKLTKKGNPYHPLYLKETLKPFYLTANESTSIESTPGHLSDHTRMRDYSPQHILTE